MKKTLLLLLFGTIAYAQPNITAPIDISTCDSFNFQSQTGTNYDGFAEFNASYNSIIMLAGQDASLYNVTYHETAEDAQLGVNAIANPGNYYNINPFTQTIYTRVTEIAIPSNYTTAVFNLIVLPIPLPIPELPTLYLIDTNGDGIEMADLTTQENYILEWQTSENMEITYYQSETNAINETSEIVNPQSYNTFSTTLYAKLKMPDSPCYLITEINIIVLPADFVTPSPTGESLYGYLSGDTLADIPVEGENIQWYATATGDTPLPMSTEPANNTFYYATQTINNQESTERLAVKAYSVLMDTEDNAFTTLNYYPNPASNILNIENTNGIDTVSVVNTLGQTVFTKTINSTSAQVDVSSLGKGVYFVTVTSGNASKIIKVIKE